MAEAGDIQTTSVSLMLGPRGIQVDERGRIRFVDPEILQGIIAGRPEGIRPELAGAGNTIQCACNNYQCGGHPAIEDVIRPAEEIRPQQPRPPAPGA
jgi:hypothetical protein